MKARKTSRSVPQSQLRIIAGRWRGRRLNFPNVDGLRPTGDRIRETLFNWLQPDLPGARCLDLFSGSGALGLEALSRGSESVTLIELNKLAAAQLLENLTLLQATNAQLLNTSAMNWLQSPATGTFDIVFLDPPFAANLWNSAIKSLEDGGYLSENAVIYIETPKNLHIDFPGNWTQRREKSAGDVTYRLYDRAASPD